MNNKFQQFSVKLLASTLAVIMAVPIDAFAMKQKQDRSYAASTSVMDSQEIKNDTPRQTDQPSLLKSEISTEAVQTIDFVKILLLESLLIKAGKIKIIPKIAVYDIISEIE